MRLIATTVVRESTYGRQRSGWIYDVDWESGRVLEQLPVPDPRFPESDDNPRGGMRGGRGVAAVGSDILVASYDTLHRYGAGWELVERIEHPLLVGLHEIHWDGSALWVSATGIDAIVRVTLDGAVTLAWDPHASELAVELGLRARPDPVDGSVDYVRGAAPLVDQCHINGVTRFGDDTIVNCGLLRRPRGTGQRLVSRARWKLGVPQRGPGSRPPGGSLVVRVGPDGAIDPLLRLDGHDVPTHNGQLLDADRVVVNDSTANIVRVFSVASGEPVATIPIEGAWLRGLCVVDDARLLVGTAPATLALVDLDEQRVVRRVALSVDPNEAVHGLAWVDRP